MPQPTYNQQVQSFKLNRDELYSVFFSRVSEHEEFIDAAGRPL